MALSDTKIRQAKPADKPYKLSDRDGLYLYVTPKGSKLWRYKFRLNGKEYTYAIGKYPEITLQVAREELIQARLLVAKGQNPTHVRQLAKEQQSYESQNTFEKIAQEWLAELNNGKETKHISQIDSRLRNYVYPIIGKLAITEIKPNHILTCLNQFKANGYLTTGIITYRIMHKVFLYALQTLRVESCPTIPFKGFLKSSSTVHAEALTKDQLIQYINALETLGCTGNIKQAMQALMYTAVRSVELRRAKWSEIRLDEALWVIPAENMKKNRTHVVPLSRQMVQVLEEAKNFSDSSFVFQNSWSNGAMIGASTFNTNLAKMGMNCTAHDFRATFSTHLNEMGYDERHIEMQLAHVQDNKTQASYNHAKYLDQRRQMMQDWADYLDSLCYT